MKDVFDDPKFCSSMIRSCKFLNDLSCEIFPKSRILTSGFTGKRVKCDECKRAYQEAKK